MHNFTLPIFCLLVAQLDTGQPAKPPNALPITPAQTSSSGDESSTPKSNLFQPPTFPVRPRTAAPATPIDSPNDSPAPTAGLSTPTPPLTSTDSLEEQGTSIVIQATAEQPLSGRPSSTSVALAKSIVTDALSLHQQNSLSGIGTSLLSVLERSSNRAQQLQTVKAYWSLCLGMADYHHALDEASFLSALADASSAADQSQWRACLATAQARQQEATLATIAAQYDLADAISRSQTDGLPLPSDAPLVGEYRTRFDALFANREAPAGLIRINAALPHYLALIAARAESVEAARESRDALLAAYESGQNALVDVLDAQVHLRDERISLLAVVRDYNHAIADYALHVAGSGLSHAEIVSMLIETTRVSPSEAADSGPATDDRVATRPAPVGLVPVKPPPPASAVTPPGSFPIPNVAPAPLHLPMP